MRLIGIDTPETKKPNAPIECFGPEASAFTDVAAPGRHPRFGSNATSTARDDYGRLLGYVYLRTERRRLFVNLEIIEQGYATPLTIAPNSHVRT